MVEKERIRAFTSASRCCRSTCRCSSSWACAARSSDRHAQVRRRVRLALARQAGHVRFRRRLDKSLSVRLPGAPLGVRPDPVPQRRSARARGASKECRVTDVEFDDGRRASSRARHRGRPRAAMAAALPGRRVGPRHLLANQFGIKRRNTKHNSAAIFGHFSGAKRTAGQGRRQHQHLLVRSRLVLVHPAGRRRHERGRGVLAVLHEVAQDRSDAVLPGHDRARARRWPSGCATPS